MLITSTRQAVSLKLFLSNFHEFFCQVELGRKKMVWDDGLSVKEVTEMKKKTPPFPSRERNLAMRRRGPRRSSSLGEASPIGVPPVQSQNAVELDRRTCEDPYNRYRNV